jgi:hypothetical protein
MTRIALSWGLVISLLVSATALGQPFPNRPIRMVVPFEPGGSMDVVGRTLIEPWGNNLKQQLVIDNRGGAGGTVGTTIVAKATPDGHTLLYANLGPLSIGPSLYRKLGYDLFEDLAPVSLVGSSPIVIFVLTSLPVQSVKDFVAYAKTKPGQLNYATSGGSGYISPVSCSRQAGIDMVHVPYKGIGQAAPTSPAAEFRSWSTLIGHYRALKARLRQDHRRHSPQHAYARRPPARRPLPIFRAPHGMQGRACGTPCRDRAVHQTLVAALATPELRARSRFSARADRQSTPRAAASPRRVGEVEQGNQGTKPRRSDRAKFDQPVSWS